MNGSARVIKSILRISDCVLVACFVHLRLREETVRSCHDCIASIAYLERVESACERPTAPITRHNCEYCFSTRISMFESKIRLKGCLQSSRYPVSRPLEADPAKLDLTEACQLISRSARKGSH